MAIQDTELSIQGNTNSSIRSPKKVKGNRLSQKGEVENYLSRITNLPLLTEEEEKAFGETILKGRNADASPEEKASAKEAAKQLANGNLRLVISIAKEYTNRGLPLIDLISAGNVGLLHSAELFDYRKARFTTYATRGIRDEISHTIMANGHAIRIPEEKILQYTQVSRAKKQLEQKLMREPSPKEIAESMEGFTPEQVTSLLKMPLQVVSTDNPIGPENDSYSLQDMIPDTSSDIDKSILQEEDEKTVATVLAVLTDREREFIRLLYGLNGEAPLSLQEVGDRYGISRERVRQIRETALSKMRKALGDDDA
mgnify:FL=1